MERPLSFLSDNSLSKALSLGLAVAQRMGCGYRPIPGFSKKIVAWEGPKLPLAIAELLAEYKQRQAANHQKQKPLAMGTQ